MRQAFDTRNLTESSQPHQVTGIVFILQMRYYVMTSPLDIHSAIFTVKTICEEFALKESSGKLGRGDGSLFKKKFFF